eukprot:CAMPEP_0178724410 /NCGR_PEP_ID=MMETSP0699-20121125/26090_1 /TAXON_ID=265572 /ORGANISM="Extubocellulus spinifer, Strain CCMP396" /LENGTH=480 /DNA_ID=CAMNT_0020375605 /DNA_START=165 /DNA_END=1607 /DNA_ORIENTATION=+
MEPSSSEDVTDAATTEIERTGKDGDGDEGGRRSIIFGLKRERSSSTIGSNGNNGSRGSLHGSFGGASSHGPLVGTLNDVFPPIEPPGIYQTRTCAEEEQTRPGLDPSNPSLLFGSAEPAIPVPGQATLTLSMQGNRRSNDGIFLPADYKRKDSFTAPPPRKGRRRSDEPDLCLHKVMSTPSLSFMEHQALFHGGGDGNLGLGLGEEGMVPLNDIPTMMSLSDGEEAVNSSIERLLAAEKKVPAAPANSPSSSMNRVRSMPALDFHHQQKDADTEMDENDASRGDEAPMSDAFADTNPEDFFKSIIENSGYLTNPIDTLSVTDFFLEYTPEQIAAYDNDVTGAVRTDDLDALRRIWRGGKTLQCSNRFGESVVHIACRRGSLPVVKFLLDEARVSIRVRDDMGRTVLHDACWASEPSFDVVEILIEREPDLLLLGDKRGHTPLAYVRKEKWADWCRFLNAKRDLLVPRGDIVKPKSCEMAL